MPIGKRAGLLGAVGATGGVFLNYGFLDVLPHISLDGLTMREEGYTETGGGDGLNLQVAPYYANSLRGSIGSDFKTSFNLFGATVSPEARLGYRYDLVNSPVKLKAGFVSTGGLGTPGNTFTFVGPDPDTGNAVAGPEPGRRHRYLAPGRQLRLDPRQQRIDHPGRHPDAAGPYLTRVFWSLRASRVLT